MLSHDTPRAPAPPGPLQKAITSKLSEAFTPAHLEVINETHLHSAPIGAEGLFKIVVVSAGFEGMELIDRHRTVHRVLAQELGGALHGITIHARTFEEWRRMGGVAAETRRCRGDAEAQGS